MANTYRPAVRDELLHRHSGRTCDHRDGAPITWNGHLCEGANLVAPIGVEFCLWTKCSKHDVPANAAEIGCIEYVTCEPCLEAHRKQLAITDEDIVEVDHG